jgi:peptidoglycan/LPS O-acetylase OafA/YrhL
MEIPTSRKKPATIAALAGARALPPLLIVLYHFSEGHHYSQVHLLDQVVTRGYLWVEFFFALSGFVLTHVYGARVRELWTTAGYAGFLKARLARLYPLHLFLLLLLLAMVVGAREAAALGGYRSIYDLQYHPMVDGKGFVLSLLLLQGWNTLGYLTWNGVSWFVSVEFALCLLFPLLLRAQAGGAWRGWALVAAGLAGLLALNATSPHGLDITFHNGVLRGLADFSAGVGMAALYRRAGKDILPDWGFSLIQLGLILAFFYVITHFGWSHSRYDILSVLPMLAMIPALAFDKGVVAGLLKLRLPQRLGDWSYAVYLGQTVWLQGLRIAQQRLYPAPDAIVLGTKFSTLMWWLEPTLLVLVCALWGGLLAEGVEKPAARRLRQWLDRPRAGAPASGIS